ncbi:unnamed protein product [Effrenium voratum]|uniref:Peptidase A1 domain-containing protein n=1 Tax=Effrenium voratum TaxID=2562239 RepID=A0AA36MRM5_9DINO|nr:unnamed protein product [Effrenium voratum]
MAASHILLFCLTVSFGEGAVGNDRIEHTRLYGNINAYAYYFAELLVGSPPQAVSVIVDTGSALCGFPCVGCSHCGNHLNPLFNMKASNTSQSLPCGMGCDRCQADRCGYLESYTEGSSISGVWFKDLVRLNGSDGDNQAVFASLGCHTDERKLFYTQTVNGIFGLAPHKITGSSNVLRDMFKDQAHVRDAVFAFCLAEWGGMLTVGGYDSSYNAPGETLSWVNLHHVGYYGVGLQQIIFDGIVVATQRSFGTTVVDTGTTFTYLPQEIYYSLEQALTNRCSNEKCAASAEGDSCWKLTSGSHAFPSHFPNISLMFTSGSLQVAVNWPATAYMFRGGRGDVWCYAFANNGMSRETVLGISFFLHKNIVFDTTQSKLGVAEANCPQHHYHAKINTDFPEPEPSFDLPPARAAKAQTQWVAIMLGAAGVLLLLLSCAMCAWAYCMMDTEDTNDKDTEMGSRLVYPAK